MTIQDLSDRAFDMSEAATETGYGCADTPEGRVRVKYTRHAGFSYWLNNVDVGAARVRAALTQVAS